MNNLLNSTPVGRIIQNENTPLRESRFENFLIPYYQRGYRWDSINVIALLEDIHNFITKDEGKYCLQPIVVVPRKDRYGHNIWEVVDGQQRLITMFIIFKYIDKKRYRIVFENREKSTEFLENLSSDNFSDEEPDFHFMSQAYKIVAEWFSDKMKNDVSYDDDFYSRITRKVEVIWYQVNELENFIPGNTDVQLENKKIDIFNRLNIGKIPLTDSELIRALLLSKIRYGLSDRESIMRQAEISAEWHRMEMELREEKFWYFLTNIDLDKVSSSIELIFNLLADSDSTKYSTYLWFERKIKADDQSQEKENAEELWKTTKEIFTKFKHWYSDITLYHHLGYLLSQDKKNLKNLQNILDNSNQDKSAFKTWVINEVKEEFKQILFSELSYDNNKSDVIKVFLLYNILTLEGNNSIVESSFPFHLYKKSQKETPWSLEHIHAQNSEDMKDPIAIKNWLEETLQAIQNISEIEIIHEYELEDNKSSKIEVGKEIKEEIIKLLKTDLKDFERFNILRAKITSIFDSNSVHILDNLALLSAKDNSSLNNAIFPVKRNRILDLFKQGKYIPQTTLNVFLKYYSSADLQPYYWSTVDKKEYLNNIKSTLKNYIS